MSAQFKYSDVLTVDTLALVLSITVGIIISNKMKNKYVNIY
jgi:hypothetical protein